MEGTERAEFAVSCLKSRYGSERVKDLTQCHTGDSMRSYVLPLWYRKPKEMLEQYPHLQLYQAHCLVCKVAMYVRVIAFCKAKGIEYLVDGMRESQGFFVDLPEMRSRFQSLCAQNKVELITPVYDLVPDQKRKRMLCDRGLPTKTIEPQCFLGCPLAGVLSDGERESLASFFDTELASVAIRDTEQLVLNN